jgi:cyclomaltodextrinase
VAAVRSQFHDAGTVYFDSVSMYVSAYHESCCPRWLTDAVVYGLGPWEFLPFGNGNAFRGIVAKLPELDALGVNLLYHLPIWEKEGWYNITDHFTLFRKYGPEQDLRTLVDEAHRRGMRVILDLAGTIGVPFESELRSEHPEWFILGGFGQLYHSWGDLCGLDQNRPDVQQYFVEVAAHYVEQCDIDGYRCDSAMTSPYIMYQKIWEAILRIKPDAMLLAEDQISPIGLETAFDAAYDFVFLDRITSMISDPHEAAGTARWLEAQRASYPPGALRMRYLEGHDLDSTIASRCGFAGSRAFATLLLTIDGLPMIYNGQEVGNRNPQVGWWKPLIEWSNPDAARYREIYTTLTGIRARYPALRRGSLIAVASSDDRVTAFARILPGKQTVLTVKFLGRGARNAAGSLSGNAGGKEGHQPVGTTRGRSSRSVQSRLLHLDDDPLSAPYLPGFAYLGGHAVAWATHPRDLIAGEGWMQIIGPPLWRPARLPTAARRQ